MLAASCSTRRKPRLSVERGVEPAFSSAVVLLALPPDWPFTREPDAATGFDELVIRAQG